MDSSRIVNTYAADGTKLRSVYKTNAATLMFPLGHQCEQEHIDYLERTVDYCGSVRYEHDGKHRNTLIYNTEGYYSTADSAFFAYQKDYQGNIAQVWQVSDSSGFFSEPKMVQLNEYYLDGTPTPRTIGAEAQPYKYNGNEWVRFNGNDAYDFNARQYQSTLLRFDRPDDFAEKYYNISPYAFCGGNMVKYTDPSGMKIDFSNLTKEEQEQINLIYEAERQNSELFNKLYTALDESPTVYTVCLGGTDTVNGEQVYGQYNQEDNSISFLDVNYATTPTVYIEEMFHAYQKGENSGLYSQEEFNYEFEAKVAKTFILNDMETLCDLIPGMENYQNHIILDFEHPTNKDIFSNDFISSYKSAAQTYSNFNTINHVGNIHYKKDTKQNPHSLIRLFK